MQLLHNALGPAALFIALLLFFDFLRKHRRPPGFIAALTAAYVLMFVSAVTLTLAPIGVPGLDRSAPMVQASDLVASIAVSATQAFAAFILLRGNAKFPSIPVPLALGILGAFKALFDFALNASKEVFEVLQSFDVAAASASVLVMALALVVSSSEPRLKLAVAVTGLVFSASQLGYYLPPDTLRMIAATASKVGGIAFALVAIAVASTLPPKPAMVPAKRLST